MDLQIAALVEREQLVVHYACENDLGVDVYLHQYARTHPRPVRSSYVFAERSGTLCSTSGRCSTRRSWFRRGKAVRAPRSSRPANG
jgi:hypothetical protein